jgi:hypothetical protein
MALGSTQPLTEMSTRNLPGGGQRRPARKADNRLSIENVGASTSHNPMGLHVLLQEQFYLYFIRMNFWNDQKTHPLPSEAET